MTRLLPWTWRFSRKTGTPGPSTGYLTDRRPPTGNAVVYSSLAKCHFRRPSHALVLEIPDSCFDQPVCRPAGSHCPRPPRPECYRPGRGYPRSPRPDSYPGSRYPLPLPTGWSILSSEQLPVPPPRFSTPNCLCGTPSPLLCSSFPDTLVPGSSDGGVDGGAGGLVK